MHFNKMHDILHVLNHFTYTMHNVCYIMFVQFMCTKITNMKMHLPKYTFYTTMLLSEIYNDLPTTS